MDSGVGSIQTLPLNYTLFPYQKPRRKPRKTCYEKWLAGSALALVWPYLILFWIIQLCFWNLLWFFEVIPADIGPISELWISHLTGSLGFVLVLLFISGFDKYTAARKAWIDALSSLNTYAQDISAKIDPELLKSKWNEAEVRDAVYTIFHFNRTLPFSLKWSFRSDRGINISKLAMPSDLKKRVRTFQIQGGFIWDFLSTESLRAYHKLYQKGVLLVDNGPTNLNLHDLSNAVAGVDKTRQIKLPFSYTMAIYSIIFTFYIFFSLHLYPLYGWFSVAVMTFIIYTSLGFVLISGKVSDPFEKPDKNPFLSGFDIGGDARDTARNMDAQLFHIFSKAKLDVTSGGEIRDSTSIK